MTPDEYVTLQEANKKIYELARNEEEKRLFLGKMLDAERQFICENMRPISVDQTVSDQRLSLSLSPKAKDMTPDPKDSKTLFTACEKVTPENFFDRVSATEKHSGKEVDLKTLLKDNPEAIQRLCDIFNDHLKANLKKQFGTQDHLQMFEDDKHIGYKQAPERIKNPDAEVTHIMERARNLAASQQQSPEAPREDTPELEEDLSQSASFH